MVRVIGCKKEFAPMDLKLIIYQRLLMTTWFYKIAGGIEALD